MTYPVDDAGNVRVDFVWGHMPMQPDQGRTWNVIDNITTDGNWTVIKEIGSDNLTDSWNNLSFGTGDGGNTRTQTFEWGNHDMITEGYANYPQFLPNYAGDGDTGLEIVMPNLVGMTSLQFLAALQATGWDDSVNTTPRYAGSTASNNGKVYSQTPAAGTLIGVQDSPDVVVYERPHVPNVVDFDTVANAAAFLEDFGLVLGTSTTSTVGATAENDGWVKSQSIASGTAVDGGTAVNLVAYDYVEAPAPATTGPVSGFNRTPTLPGWSLNGNQSAMYVVGQTVKPTVGDTISVTGSDNASHNVSWTVELVENDSAYNTGGTAVKVTLVTGSIDSDTATGGTWTKI